MCSLTGTDSLAHVLLQLEQQLAAEDANSHVQPGVEDAEALWLGHSDFFSTQAPPAAAAEPGRRLAPHQHQFTGIDLRRPNGLAAAPAPVQEAAAVEGGEDPCPRCGSRDTRRKGYMYSRGKLHHICKGCKRSWIKGGTLRKDVVEGDPCPRCGSQDTKFHSHTPRGKLQHFCKGCGRTWIKGGTLQKDVVELDPCPRCGSQDTKYRSSTGGIPRYFCKGCQRSWIKGGKLGVDVLERDPRPRCGSRDTTLRGYNNKSSSRPKHYCKGCQRYWIEGTRLRKSVLKRDRKASLLSPSCHAATTTDGASEVATETVLAAPPAALVAEEDSDSLAHMFWQPEVEDVVALGLSDLPSAGKAPLDDDLLVWPVEFDTDALWVSDDDPAGLLLNIP